MLNMAARVLILSEHSPVWRSTRMQASSMWSTAPEQTKIFFLSRMIAMLPETNCRPINKNICENRGVA